MKAATALTFLVCTYVADGRELVHLDVLDLLQPGVERGDVRGNRVDVDALGGEDDGVLTLIGRNLASPVDDDVKGGLVDLLTIGLVSGGTAGKNQLVELSVGDAVVVAGATLSGAAVGVVLLALGILVGNVGEVDLGHRKGR